MMNEAHKRLIRERYENAVHEYCLVWCQAHGVEYTPELWVAGEVGTVLKIGNRYVAFLKIKKEVDGV